MFTSQMRVASLTRPGMVTEVSEERSRWGKAGPWPSRSWEEEAICRGSGERGVEEYKGPGGLWGFLYRGIMVTRRFIEL